MRGFRDLRARLGVGLFSAVLAGILLLATGGIFLADRAIRGGSHARAQIDALESAALVASRVETEMEALGAVRAGLTGPAAEVSGVAASVARRSGMIELLILDRYSARRTPLPTRSPAVRDAAAEVSLSGAELVRLARMGDVAVVVIAVPLRVADTLVGVAAASYRPAVLFRGLMAQRVPGRNAATLRFGADTALRIGADVPGMDRVTEPVALATSGWSIEVAHASSAGAVRLVLMPLGALAIILLGVGILGERRQATQLAERSAELERLSTELLRTNRMKSEFLANVSHELRTPLNAIVGFVELLRDGVYGDLSPRQAGPVERIAGSASHLRHLVDQVLDIAKMAAGRMEVHPEQVVLRPFVLNVVGELESLSNDRGLTLSIAVGASLPRVNTDPAHLRQILVNLVGNAIKYTPSGGVAVRARVVETGEGAHAPATPDDPVLQSQAPDTARRWVALQVIDTGVGIAAADQKRIFEEFEQVSPGSRSDSAHRGTGLGLPISRRLARLLGGELTVESQLGKGSTFTLWLPLGSESSEAPPGSPESADRATPISA